MSPPLDLPKPPVTILRLSLACTALNGQLTLSLYYKQEIHYTSSANPLNVSHIIKVETLKILSDFHRTLPNLTFVKLPEKINLPMDHPENTGWFLIFRNTTLVTVTYYKEPTRVFRMPMDKRIDLNHICFHEIKEPFPFQNWGYTVQALCACLAVGIVIFIICRAKISRRCNSTICFSNPNEQGYGMASLPS